jgi:YesN/AraC family two-component response regulator
VKRLQKLSRVKTEGVAFKSIVDEVCIDTVKQLLLATHISFNSMSEQLGFNEPRSFYRCFKK